MDEGFEETSSSMEFREGRVDKERFFENKKLRKQVHYDVDWWVISTLCVGKEVEKVLEGMYFTMIRKLVEGIEKDDFYR